jgi:hypothetical protein
MPQQVRPEHGRSDESCPKYRKSQASDVLGTEPMVLISVLPTRSSQGDTHSIDGSTRDIQDTLQYKPGNTHLSFELGESKQENPMQHRNNGTCTHGDKHACTEWTPLGCPEARKDRHNCAADANEGDLRQSVSRRSIQNQT